MLNKKKFEFFVSLDRRYLETFCDRINIGLDIDDLTDDLLPDLMEYLFYEYFPELDGIRVDDNSGYGLSRTSYDLYRNFEWDGDYSAGKIDMFFKVLDDLAIGNSED